MVQKARVLFPLSQIGAIDESQRSQIIKQSKIYGKYDKLIERDSAFEVLLAEREAQLKEAENEEVKQGKGSTKAAKVPAPKKKAGVLSKVTKAVITAVTATVATAIGNEVSGRVTGKKKNTSAKESAGKVVKSATSAATRTITREITRSILGNLGK